MFPTVKAEEPTPPARPSKTNAIVPFKFNVCKESLIIDKLVAPTSGRTIKVVVLLFPKKGIVKGNVSTVLTYAACNSRVLEH